MVSLYNKVFKYSCNKWNLCLVILFYIGCRTNANSIPEYLYWNHLLLICLHTYCYKNQFSWRRDTICSLFGLYEQQESHILFLIFFTKKFLFGFNTMHLFNCVDVIWLLIWRRVPPPFLFRSSLNGVQKPWIKIWAEEKVSSSFVSVIIKTSSSSITLFFK